MIKELFNTTIKKIVGGIFLGVLGIVIYFGINIYDVYFNKYPKLLEDYKKDTNDLKKLVIDFRKTATEAVKQSQDYAKIVNEKQAFIEQFQRERKSYKDDIKIVYEDNCKEQMKNCGCDTSNYKKPSKIKIILERLKTKK